MPVNIEQWHAEIESFNSYSLHSIAKLHLNLFNLLFNMLLVSFCIIALTACYITKFQIFLYLTTLFLCDFLPFHSTFISHSNFNHFSKFTLIERSFTNFLYIISFIEKKKKFSCCYWNINSLIAHNLSKLSQLEAYNLVYKHDFICISEMLFDSSIQEGNKNIQLDGCNLLRAAHPSNSK